MDETAIHKPPDEKRLNPFAFPSETNIRFNLVVFAAIMLGLDTFVQLIDLTTGSANPLDPSKIFPKPSQAADPAQFFAETRDSAIAALAHSIPALLVLAVGIGLLVAVAYTLYRTHPQRLRRAMHLSVFPMQQDPKFAAEIQSLAQLAGVSPVPVVEIDGNSTSADGQVFGFSRRYSIRLGARSRLLLRKALPEFRGVVFHELAHVVNQDVGRTYFSQSLWFTVVLLLVVPLALVYVVNYGQEVVRIAATLLGADHRNIVRFVVVVTPIFVLIVAQLAGQVALFAATRASLLRVREVYADWRAALWGAREGLSRVLAQNEGRPGRRFDWSAMWRLHPSSRTRLRLLDNPRALFEMPNDLPFLVGALQAAALSGLLYLAILAASESNSLITLVQAWLALIGMSSGLAAIVEFDVVVMSSLAYLFIAAAISVPFLVIGYLSAGTLGLQTIRDSAASAALDEKQGCMGSVRILIPAAIYAVGLQVGFALTPVNLFSPIQALADFQGGVAPVLEVVLGIVLWLVVVTLLTWLWLLWARYASLRWLTRHTGSKSPDRRRRLLNVHLSILSWLVFVPALTAQIAIWTLISAPGNTSYFALALGAAAICFPLAAIAAAAGWLAVELLSLGPITCPACGRRTKHRHAVGRRCEHCGAELAAWIIAQPRQA